LTAEVFEDNVKRWSGDHIIDPDLIPGALFANRPLNVRPAQMTDLAPTVLTALGIPVPAHLEGGSLLE
jgi:bisphosphoglycerate-independent phosphoglycerate mutase (AlkP superfamily)